MGVQCSVWSIKRVCIHTWFLDAEAFCVAVVNSANSNLMLLQAGSLVPGRTVRLAVN